MLDEIFAGNERAKARLLDKEQGLRSHAILLYGEGGLGKKTLALLLACRFAAEENYTGDVDFFGRQENRLILERKHPDVTLLGAEGSIKVADVRTVVREAYLKPNQAEKKVYILADSQNMTPQAQNALLKTLEEPPESTVIILTADTRESLLETILSRVQAIPLFPVGKGEGMAYLKNRIPGLDEAQAENALYSFGGNLGRVLAVLEAGEKNQAYALGEEIALAISGGKLYDVAVQVEKCRANRALFLDTCTRLMQIMDEVLTAKVGRETAYPELAKKMSMTRVCKVLEELDRIRRQAVFNPNLSLASTGLVLCLMEEH